MKVAIIMGSTSDLDIMSQAINVLEGFGVEVVKRVISAHRTPDLMCEFAKSAKANGIGAIIAGAGGAAHVAGVVAGMTTVPVIGVPIQTKALGGMDSLLSIVQMPAGIPVATMAINGSKNAGLFAAQILALFIENNGRIVFAGRGDRATVKFDCKGLLAPDKAALAAKEKGCRLGTSFSFEVDLKYRFGVERHLFRADYTAAPPIFAFKNFRFHFCLLKRFFVYILFFQAFKNGLK